MLSNLKLIFIHGVNRQTTNYSHGLFLKILDACRKKLRAARRNEEEIRSTLARVVHHEVLWADLTTPLTNRYLQLQYDRPRFPWDHFLKETDPLCMQIMQYVKDKGDRHTGPMNILREVDEDVAKIFLRTNLGEFVPGQDKHAILVAHSLGSVIAFDYVFCFRDRCRLDPAVTIHAFVTMGSPIPLFTSAMGHPDSDLELPANVRKWVNVVSRNDVVARRMTPFFRKIPVVEKNILSGIFPLQSHASYWKSRQTARLIADEVLGALEAKEETKKGVPPPLPLIPESIK